VTRRPSHADEDHGSSRYEAEIMKFMKYRFLAVVFLFFVPFAVAAPPRAIPGITAKDAFPAACVDCHVKEHRISVLLKAPTMKKKHPAVATTNIPASCIKCHAAKSKAVPPLAPLMHRIHFAKGDAGDFVKQFGGECTHCHKLDKKSGKWSLPSAAEK
jgi:hypothetical protein